MSLNKSKLSSINTRKYLYGLFFAVILFHVFSEIAVAREAVNDFSSIVYLTSECAAIGCIAFGANILLRMCILAENSAQLKEDRAKTQVKEDIKATFYVLWRCWIWLRQRVKLA